MLLQVIKLIVIVGVPVWLIYSARREAALAWLGVTAPLQILSSTLTVAVTPMLGFGIAALPFVVRELVRGGRKMTKSEALVLLSGLLMLVGMVIFGILWPWPDTSGQRPVNQLAFGRSVIFTFRYACEICVALYVAHTVRRLKHPSEVLRYVVVGTCIVAVGVLVQLTTGFDMYHVLNSAADNSVAFASLSDIGRSGGVCMEPRDAAQWCAAGILICIGLDKLGKARWPLMLLQLLGLAGTLSTSGLVVLTVCTATMALMVDTGRKAFAVLIAIFLAVIILSAAVPRLREYKETYNLLLSARLAAERSSEDDSVIVKAVNKLEVFDYMAANFLLSNPAYIPMGVGPGTISLAATDYARPSDLASYDGRIDSIPAMGLVGIVSNVGIIGLIVWLALAYRCYRRTGTMHARTRLPAWRETQVFVVTFSVYYLWMAREIWYLVIGLGIGAAMLVRDMDLQARATISDSPTSGADK